ncbi:hypothetical protein RHO12_01400 [Orbus sturtevantii]|uniref:hypothetical protein n=1 Tax=Orbus sturtevantii TaxID=3074109 RepID=UPI00370D368B
MTTTIKTLSGACYKMTKSRFVVDDTYAPERNGVEVLGFGDVLSTAACYIK